MFRLPISAESTRSSKLRALPNWPRLHLEIVRMWSFDTSRDPGQSVVRPARSQSVILSGDLVRVKGMGDAWKPMRFEYVEDGIAHFTTGLL